MQAERKEREEEKTIEVVDKVSTKRAIEILNVEIVIQDLVLSKKVKGVVLRRSYILGYKLVGIRRIVVGYIQLSRTGINRYSIRIKQ